MINAYFDEVTRIIGEHNDICTQFPGDGVMATFNVPVEDPGHARNAFDAACAILASVVARDFAGERLRVRIGVTDRRRCSLATSAAAHARATRLTATP